MSEPKTDGQAWRVWEIWSASGDEAGPRFHGTCFAPTFQVACERFADGVPAFGLGFNRRRLTFVGCGLFPSKGEARQAPGVSAPEKLFERGLDWIQCDDRDAWFVPVAGVIARIERTDDGWWSAELRRGGLPEGCPHQTKDDDHAILLDWLRDRIRGLVAEGVRIVGTEL